MQQFTCVNEGYIRRVDDVGRIVIPKTIRDRYGIQEGDEFEIYSIESEDKTFIGLTKARSTFLDPRYEVAMSVLEEFGYDPPQELLDILKGQE